MDRVDEMTNGELERRGHSEHVLVAELDRVEALTKRLCLTGADLGCWYDRSKIIRRLLHENSRTA